jgi:alpha-beta hydrolase superfamily lysophospholipase
VRLIQNNRGGNIFCRHFWYPNPFGRTGCPKGILFYFHGLFLHSGVSGEMELCQELAVTNNFHVIAFDHAGHGRSASDEDRGIVPNWEWFVRDAIMVVSTSVPEIQSAYNKPIPFFFFGISLGGAVAIHTALHFQNHSNVKPFGGAVLVSPAIYGNMFVNDFLLATLKFINFCGGGWLAVGPAADTSHFATEEDYELFKKDKYCYSGRLTLTMGNTLLTLTEETQKVCSLVAFPYCLFHSLDDPVVKVTGSQQLHSSSQTVVQDKVYYEYNNLGHNVLCDEVAFENCLKWLKGRCKKL